MKLLEILNTKPEIKWSQQNHQWFGVFKISDSTYTIHLDEYTYEKYEILDFGFDTDGEINAKNSNKPSASVIGAVLNGAYPKITEINPDIILISVVKASGLIDSRRSLYNTLISWFQKRSDFLYSSEWVENNKAFYKIIAKQKPKDLDVFILTAQTNK